MHPSAGSDPAFKSLGPLIDIHLRMHPCIDQIMSKAHAKIPTIFHVREFYDAAQPINLFKTHTWNLLEMDADAIFHAACSLLKTINNDEDRFLFMSAALPTMHFLNTFLSHPRSDVS